MATSHHEVTAASTSPSAQASRKQPKAARFTAPGDAAPDPTSRIGPALRPAASVPRTPSL